MHPLRMSGSFRRQPNKPRALLSILFLVKYCHNLRSTKHTERKRHSISCKATLFIKIDIVENGKTWLRHRFFGLLPRFKTVDEDISDLQYQHMWYQNDRNFLLC